MKKVKAQKKSPAVDYRESLIEELKGDEKAQYAYLKASLEENSDMPEVFLKAVETVATKLVALVTSPKRLGSIVKTFIVFFQTNALRDLNPWLKFWMRWDLNSPSHQKLLKF